jgi:hypothetical protein
MSGASGKIVSGLILGMLLLVSGCSEPEVIVDHDCMIYYGRRIGITYSKEVC